MSSHALAYDFSASRHRRRAPHSRVTRPFVVPLGEVVVAPSSILGVQGSLRNRRPAYIWALAAVAIAVHAALVWYATHQPPVPSTPQRHEVSVQLVAPPKPPQPKIEPPKPPPPKPAARRPQQVLPQIQTAIPDPAPAADVTPVDPPVAVAPSAPPAPEPPKPEPVTAPFGRAGYLNNPPPEYPAAASRQGWQGTVLLRVRVLSTGKVDTVEVQKSSGHKVLDEEAMVTVRTWSFTPAKRGEVPIDGWASVPIEFKLDS